MAGEEENGERTCYAGIVCGGVVKGKINERNKQTGNVSNESLLEFFAESSIQM